MFDADLYPEGIPKDEFETLIMEYLPVTEQQLEKYAVYDEETKTYEWVLLNIGNAGVFFFSTSFPEIIDIKENENGTVTLTVDVICEEFGNDAVISHQLTVQFPEEGGILFLGNEILGDGLQKIPEYQYRIYNK